MSIEKRTEMQMDRMLTFRNETDTVQMERELWGQPEEMWLHRIWRKFIVKEWRMEAGRTGLLCEILSGRTGRTKEELTSQIYLYGSLLKEQDLIARQLFLWLLEMLEEDQCAEAARW